MTRFSFALLITVLAVGCGDDGQTLRVDVRTDYVPEVEFAEVEVGFDSGGAEMTYPVDFGEDFLEGVRVATFEDAPSGQVVLRARLNAADGRRVAERRVAVSLNQPATTVTIVFTRSCGGVTCPDGDDPAATECQGGACVRPECSSENVDACGVGCGSNEDCDPPESGCAQALCNEGVCFVGSERGACAAGEFCHPERGCTPEPIDMDGSMRDPDGGVDPTCGQPCDTGSACEVGTLDCSSGEPVCTPTGAAEAGVVCREAAGACDVAETCDGESTACPTDAFAETGTTCPAGFCDGLGGCGACQPGAACSTGNPCEVGATVCAGGEPTCERESFVASGVSCGDDSTGEWSTCGGFGNDCDTTGTQSRTVTSFTCDGAGSCDGDAETEMQGCARVTTGDPCGVEREETPGACVYEGDVCDETGTRQVAVTTYTCDSGGSCVGTPSTESEGCTRDTDGTTDCLDPETSTGPCLVDTGTDPCNENGSALETTTTYACSGGSCVGTDSSTTVSCTKDSTGRSCPVQPGGFLCHVYECNSTAQCVWTGDDSCGTNQVCCSDGCGFDGGGGAICPE